MPAGRHETPPGQESTTRSRVILVGALVGSVAAIVALVLAVGRGQNDAGDTFASAGAAVNTTSPTTPAVPTVTAATPSPTVEQPTAPAATSTTVPEPTATAGGEQPSAATETGRIGPSDFEPYATTVLAGEDEAWTVVPRSGETIVLVDPVDLDAAGTADLGFFAPTVTVAVGWLAGAGIEGQLGVVDLASGELVSTDLDRPARHLAADGDALWVVTAEDDGSNATLHRFDRRTLTEEAVAEVGDFVLYLDAADGRVWTAAGSTIKAFDAATLDLLVDTTTGVSPIDDIDAFGDAVWVSGGVFDAELADRELARGSVVRLDAATGAASPVQTLTDGLSIFERATVAATDGGAWVTFETTNEAFFVTDDGSLGPVLALPDDVQDAEVIGDALWVLAGGSSSGQLWAIMVPTS